MANRILSDSEEKALHAFLFALPVIDAERNKLHERIHVAGDKLAARAHKYLTLANEYNERKRFARDMANPPANVYPGWHSRRAPVKPQDPTTRVQVLYISPKLHTVKRRKVKTYREPLHAHSKRWAGIDGGRAITPPPVRKVAHGSKPAKSAAELSASARKAWQTRRENQQSIGSQV